MLEQKRDGWRGRRHHREWLSSLRRFAFPRIGKMPVSEVTSADVLGIAAVPHGFRTSFRDWAGEETDHPREVIEAALAHVVRNRVEAAYARSDLFERRRVLMDDWSRYLAQGIGCPHQVRQGGLARGRPG